MILILDLDRTLNILPPSIHSVRELAPIELSDRNDAALWKWIANHVSMVEYRVHEQAKKTVELLSRQVSAVIVNTGRPEAARYATACWLRRHFHVDRLFMRAHGDFRATAQVKRDNYLAGIAPLYRNHLICAVDDNIRAVQMYREIGAVALTAPGCWSSLSDALAEAARSRSLESILSHCAQSVADQMREMPSSRRTDACPEM